MRQTVSTVVVDVKKKRKKRKMKNIVVLVNTGHISLHETKVTVICDIIDITYQPSFTALSEQRFIHILHCLQLTLMLLVAHGFFYIVYCYTSLSFSSGELKLHESCLWSLM